MMEVSDNVQDVLNNAIFAAQSNEHEYVTPEHILSAILLEPRSQQWLSMAGGDLFILKRNLDSFFQKKMTKVSGVSSPVYSYFATELLMIAEQQCLGAGREKIQLDHLLVSFFYLDEASSFALYFLKKAGIREFSLVQQVAHDSFGSKTLEEFENDTETEENPFLENSVLSAEDLCTELTSPEDPVIGREKELERIFHVLCRRTKNNLLLVGDAGVGKTVLGNAVAERLLQERVPECLIGFHIYSLDIGALIAGTKFRGEFEERMKVVLDFLKKKEKSILFIDEIHSLMGLGGSRDGSLSASEMLKPMLVHHGIRCIGTTTYEEYKHYVEKDHAFLRRFQKIDILEPSSAECMKILRQIKKNYENYHHVHYTDAALKKAVSLSAKYINERRLPDKAIDIIDEAGAFCQLKRGQFYHKTIKSEVFKEKTVRVDTDAIERTVAKITGISLENVVISQNDHLMKLAEHLKRCIFGQDEAADLLATAVKRAKAGFRDEGKPVASLLFIGPTGVGKTELTKQLAKYLEIPLLRFDMSEYQEKHTVAKLVGAPSGYVGYEEGGLLTEAVRRNPEAVVLLDEIEKAHVDIFSTLLQIMDYATLTDNQGRKADFRNIIFIMTSNAGAHDAGNIIGFGESEGKSRISSMMSAVKNLFTPEFRNRLDAVVPFYSLEKDQIDKIVLQQLEILRLFLIEKGISFHVTPKCCELIAKKGFSKEFGAREIARIIEREIKDPLIDVVLFRKERNVSVVSCDARDDSAFNIDFF